MAYNLPLPNQVSIRASYTQTSRTRLVEFGDGYTQRTPLGLNNKIRRVTVIHDALVPTDADQVLWVYDQAQQSGEHIVIDANALLNWEGKFYIEEVNVDLLDHQHRTITATMREVFDV